MSGRASAGRGRRRRRREAVPTTDEERALYQDMQRLKLEQAKAAKEKMLHDRLVVRTDAALLAWR